MTQSTRNEQEQDEAVISKHVQASLMGFRLFELGDMDGLLELYDPWAELRHPEGWPEPGPTVGHRAIRRQFEGLREGWSELHVVVEEIEGRGDWVVARVRWTGRGEESGADVELSYSAATRFDGDLIAAVHYCWTQEQAFEAAGWPVGDADQGKPASG